MELLRNRIRREYLAFKIVILLEPQLEIAPDAIQTILDEAAKTEPRVKKFKATDLIDRRCLDELEKTSFFSKL